MAKVSDEAKVTYYEKIKENKKQIESALQQETTLKGIIDSGEPGAEYQKITMAKENLTIVSNFILMNHLSVSLLGIKNENFLNEARKTCYKIIIYLEEVFSDYIDVPFSDYADKIELVSDFPEFDRYRMIRLLGFSISSVKDGFGENSKWKWSIIELEGRLATLSKNVIDLKKFVPGMDPRAEGFRARIEHFKLTCRLLQSSADSFRMKYELSTNRVDDFKMAINYLSALKRFYTFTNQKRETEELKKRIDIWKQKLDTDVKNSEHAARLRRLER